MKKVINMIALTMGSDGMCGGSRIFIEFAKRWANKETEVNIFVTDEGFATCTKYGVDNAKFHIISGQKFKKLGLLIFYLVLLFKGILLSLKLRFHQKRAHIVYSTSDFWPDSLTGFFMSKIFTKAKWISGFYLFAPNPFGRDNPYKGKNYLRGLLYYYSQLPIYYIVNKFADMVCVTSQPDVAKFVTTKRPETSVLVIMGGVDCSLHREIPEIKKKYDGCFIGRFHPQKGVVELVDIWRIVVNNIPDAKLLIIGYGELVDKLKEKIKKSGLSDNITINGFIDGEEKVELLNQCKVVLHPALYDSGGMAACEAMACGLPAVSFDLPALTTYYPKGMIKTPCFDLGLFAENILTLLRNKEVYDKLKKEALGWAREWNWKEKADFVFNKMFSSVSVV